MDAVELKKVELKKLIDDEHGKGFYRNIDLSGYTFYKKDSFISFKIKNISNIQTVVIKYIYCTNKTDFIKLISYCCNFWKGMGVRFVYFLEHRRPQNYTKKFLTTLGFTVIETERDKVWKYKFKSNNGFKENEILESFV